MADLMKSIKQDFVSPQKGDTVEGVITKFTSGEILVDIGAKAEAIVLERDKKILNSILSQFNLGEKVQVYVLSPESEMGNPVVSMRKQIDDIVWEKLEKLKKNKENLDVKITDSIKGGFIVLVEDGTSGFLPNSQTMFSEVGQNPVGSTISAFVLEVNRPTRKIIFSQKRGGEKDLKEAIKVLKVEQKIETTISGIVPFGLFTMINLTDSLVEGFIHISEVSWEKTEEQDMSTSYEVGSKIECMIIGFDKRAGRVNLSIRRLTPDPFEKEMEKYKPESRIKAVVSRVTSAGLVVDLAEGIEGFVKKDKIPLTTKYTEGSPIEVTVVEVDKKKHRVVLAPVLTEKPMGYR
ncbi:S1 RNA-binding domain-containing protein [Patescibacteria group bacterium]|nr:S1 RNA-binding domain-containing protein [Patescibacteria group bacterium]